MVLTSRTICILFIIYNFGDSIFLLIWLLPQLAKSKYNAKSSCLVIGNDVWNFLDYFTLIGRSLLLPLLAMWFLLLYRERALIHKLSVTEKFMFITIRSVLVLQVIVSLVRLSLNSNKLNGALFVFYSVLRLLAQSILPYYITLLSHWLSHKLVTLSCIAISTQQLIKYLNSILELNSCISGSEKDPSDALFLAEMDLILTNYIVIKIVGLCASKYFNPQKNILHVVFFSVKESLQEPLLIARQREEIQEKSQQMEEEVEAEQEKEVEEEEAAAAAAAAAAAEEEEE